MAKWNVEDCARCGTRAELVHIGPDWRRQYMVKCTCNVTHGTRPYRTGREAVSHWNEVQLRLYDTPTVTTWVDKRQRMPGQDDADPYGCIMIWDRLNGAKITGWRNTQELNREAVTHWAALPAGPGKESAHD